MCRMSWKSGEPKPAGTLWATAGRYGTAFTAATSVEQAVRFVHISCIELYPQWAKNVGNNKT
jgi:hypothetical protein